MRIKTFEAATMQEALALARAELGEEAVVLNCKHVKSGGVLGLGGGARVELMAAIDDSVPQVPKQEQVVAMPAAAPTAVKAYASMATSACATNTAVANPDTDIRQLKSDLKNLEVVVERLLSSRGDAFSMSTPLLGRLGVDEDIVRGVLADLAAIDNPMELASALAAKMQAFVAPPTLDGHRVIALVGPTGVGKTTTLAKLAARFALEQGKKVALVTADTYRIGAVEQLRTYARIMGLPLEIAMSPDEVASGVEKHRDKDVVLIDTVGRSQRSADHLTELRDFVGAACPTDTYLCVAASLGVSIQKEVIEKFSALSPTGLVVTKLDESFDCGALVNLPIKTGLGISCLTAGQNVPQDIEFADAGVIARFVTEVGQ